MKYLMFAVFLVVGGTVMSMIGWFLGIEVSSEVLGNFAMGGNIAIWVFWGVISCVFVDRYDIFGS